ncbi:GDP-fucose O-fucosyltransferase 2 [Brachionus plicatilis]|uniref:GDP-fucose protein O-fucosyltransferase 2 n=1 Tax=Brachionus plicatilis TaxID=10195 RepID=A0A3M7QWA4_BRAPC|nr:GDP-fucose O-fucosyltransferase 2 [Brachionus plicatilis]
MLIFSQNYISLIILYSILIKAVSNQVKSLKPEQLCQEQGEYCVKPREIFLFYDVNPVEGFNLRRDVYIRVANLVKQINSERRELRLNLVLPPWHNLYHWKTKQIDQSRLDWEYFFDINSLSQYIPVIELSDLIKKNNGSINLDQVYSLENDLENLNSEPFKKIVILKNCDQTIYYKKNGLFRGNFWGYSDKIAATKCQKVKFRGTNYFLAENLVKILTEYDINFLMIDRAEVIVHEDYGQTEYWKCRKSMKFSKNLIAKAHDLIESLNSDDKINFVGNYFAVHLRRGDFVKYRPSVSFTKICDQMIMVLQRLNLKKVFLATDGTDLEIAEIENCLPGFDVFKYTPSYEDLENYKDGGISIIDQIVCAHAKFFIGTKESTFSLRIQEEREILDFHPSTTFNCFCNDVKFCETTKWLLKN